jgi:hypothetical protein
LYQKNIFGINQLVGIAPFFKDIKNISGYRVISRLRLIGSGIDNNNCKKNVPEYAVSDYLDFIVHKGYEDQVSKALADYLKNNFHDYELVQLDEAYSDSVIVKYLLLLLTDYDLNYHILPKEVCPRIILPKSLDEYFNKLNSKVRYQLKKIRRDLVDDSIFNKRDSING